MTDHLDRRLAQAGEVEQRLRDLIAEAHGVLKDTKAERRALAEERVRVRVRALVDGETIADRIEESLRDHIRIGLEAYNAAVKDAIDETTVAVYRRFDTLASVMLGEDESTKETVTQHVRQWRAAGPGRTGL